LQLQWQQLLTTKNKKIRGFEGNLFFVSKN